MEPPTKRKSLIEGSDVPEKKFKFLNGDAADGEAGNEENPDENPQLGSDDEANEIPEEKITFSKDFNVTEFRRKLKGKNFIPELRHFVYLAKSKQRIITKYIQKKGKPLELVEAFERVDKDHIFHLSYICQAFQLVLMEILANAKELTESAIYASRYFIKSHSKIVEKLLQSPNSDHRKCILKLLTAMVCLEPELGKRISNTFDVISNSKTMTDLLSHSKRKVILNEHYDPEDTVRKCYIHFILSYFIEGNKMLIRNILEKYNLISLLLSGLIYDDHLTVNIVLSTLKTHVLENMEVSKTEKVNVFDIHNIRSILNLYEWKGPEFYKKMVINKNRDVNKFNNSSNEGNQNCLNSNELKIVKEQAHLFLVMLLTSRKYGIAFDAVADPRNKRNIIQRKTIATLRLYAWFEDYKSDLLINILQSCPELARKAVKRFGSIFNPKRSDAIVSCEFLNKLIKALHPQIMREGLETITLTDFTRWIKEVPLNKEILIAMKLSKVLTDSDNYLLRIKTVQLLKTMYQQYCNYMNAIIHREKLKGNDLKKMRFDILDHLITNFPSIQSISLSLFKTMNENVDETYLLEHLEVTIDLILLIAENNRMFVDKTTTVIDYLELLEPLYENCPDENFRIRIEMKIIRVILLLLPKLLTNSEKLNHFPRIFKSFINAFVNGEEKIQKAARDLLQGMFLNTNLFESSNGQVEIDLWLEGLRYINEEIREKAIEILTETFVKCYNGEISTSHVFVTTNKAVSISHDDVDERFYKNLIKLFEQIENDNCATIGGSSPTGYESSLILSKLFPLLITNETSSNIKKYLDIMVVLLFHYLPSPKMINNTYKGVFGTDHNYISSLDRNELKPHKTELQFIPKSVELYNAVISGEQRFLEIFQNTENNGSSTLIITVDEIEYKNLTKILENERLILIYIHLVVFVTLQLVKNKKFVEKHSKCSSYYLRIFLDILSKVNSDEKSIDSSKGNLKAANANVKTDNDELRANTYYFEEALKYIYFYRSELLQNFKLFDLKDSDINFLEFFHNLTDSVIHNVKIDDINSKSNPFVNDIMRNYRLKIVNQIKSFATDTVKNKGESKKIENYEAGNNIIKIITVFQLTSDDCLEILKSLSELKAKYFVSNSNQKSIYFDILICIQNRLSECEAFKFDKDLIIKLIRLYVDLSIKRSSEMNLEKLEESLYNLIRVCYQVIPSIPENFFTTIFEERKLSKFGIKLLCYCLKKRPDIDELIVELISKNLDKKELIYPILNVFFSRNKIHIDGNSLMRIFHEYKNGFMKNIEKAQKVGQVYKENYETSLYLIENCMPMNECLDFCKRNLKFDSVEIFQLKTIEKIYYKAIREEINRNKTSNDGSSSLPLIFVNFINVMINAFSVAVKRDNKIERKKIETIFFMIFEWVKHLGIESNIIENCSDEFENKLLKFSSWQMFFKTCLKIGMQLIDSEKDTEITDMELDRINSEYIKILSFLCQVIYLDSSDHPDVEQIFEMTVSHSRFFEIVLNQNTNMNAVKTEIMHLLLTLVHKNAKVMEANHIPIYLGAYQAKLTDCDRYILGLLQFYEMNDIDLHKYRPFIWGEAAIIHYSLKDDGQEEKANLEEQEPSIAQVMFLIDNHVCEYTMANFPIWRKLNTLKQLPEFKFNDPSSDTVEFGFNKLEKLIECEKRENLDLNDPYFRQLPQRDDVIKECYDPAFLIPLMSMCYAPEMYSRPVRSVQNGSLGIVFCALSSQDKDMRLAAGFAQIRYRHHFENRKFFEKPLWIQAYDNIQNGLKDLHENWLMHKKNKSSNNGDDDSVDTFNVPRVPYVSALFLAKSMNYLIDPTDIMYKVLAMYLRLKNTFNFLCVPEFNMLFHSPEVEHHKYRKFILRIIHDGIKCSSDLFILINQGVFKALLGFYGNTVTNLDTNLLILSILSVCAKIPATAYIMLEYVGILPFINSIVNNIEYYHFDIIEGLISIVSNLWYSTRSCKNFNKNFTVFDSSLYEILSKLIPHISTRITIKNYTRFVNILWKTTESIHENGGNLMKNIELKEEDINKLLSCSGKHYPIYISDILNIKLNGSHCVENKITYCSRLKNELNLSSDTILSLSSLRELVILWTRK